MLRISVFRKYSRIYESILIHKPQKKHNKNIVFFIDRNKNFGKNTHMKAIYQSF